MLERKDSFRRTVTLQLQYLSISFVCSVCNSIRVEHELTSINDDGAGIILFTLCALRRLLELVKKKLG